MTIYNDEIWASKNDDGTATVTTGKTGPAIGKKVSGPPATIKAMAGRIAAGNGGSLDFPSVDEAEAAIATEEITRLAGL